MYLPPDSPDLNPIESSYSKFKTLLRRSAERTIEGLWTRIGQLLDKFTPTNAATIFNTADTLHSHSGDVLIVVNTLVVPSVFQGTVAIGFHRRECRKDGDRREDRQDEKTTDREFVISGIIFGQCQWKRA